MFIVIIFVFFLILFALKVVLYTTPLFSIKTKLKEENVWALITGCTNKIGMEFAEQLAEKNYNLILQSNNFLKLFLFQKKLLQKYDIKVKTFMIDFRNNQNFYANFRNKIKNLNLQLVINNEEGKIYNPNFFNLINNNIYDDILLYNIFSITNIIYLILNTINSHRIIFIVVYSKYIKNNSPFISVYGASKTYVTNLMKNLQMEYKDEDDNEFGFYVITPLNISKTNSIVSPSVKNYVKNILDFGKYYPHEVMSCLNNLKF